MFRNFIKYHSLGNDLVMFDAYNEHPNHVHDMFRDTEWAPFVARLCDRHRGIGADGVIVISNYTTAHMPEMHIFNADGSQAENCLNGTRCMAHYIYSTYCSQRHFLVKIGARTVHCEVPQSLTKSNDPEIITRAGFATCSGMQEVSIPSGTFSGYVISIGNPHFIVFEPTTLEWLATHGKSIESHKLFPDKTNVEFVWKSTSKDEKPQYTMLVYERGCGITLACGTGAAALMGLLAAQNQIAAYQKVTINMPGGSLCAWVDCDGQIVLQASVKQVFKGVLDEHLKFVGTRTAR